MGHLLAPHRLLITPPRAIVRTLLMVGNYLKIRQSPACVAGTAASFGVARYQQMIETSTKQPNRRFNMCPKTTILLSAVIVLGAAFPASAATKHHHVAHVHRAIYANGGPGCSTEGQSAPPDSGDERRVKNSSS
jgi:hypothetical protein